METPHRSITAWRVLIPYNHHVYCLDHLELFPTDLDADIIRKLLTHCQNAHWSLRWPGVIPLKLPVIYIATVRLVCLHVICRTHPLPADKLQLLEVQDSISSSVDQALTFVQESFETLPCGDPCHVDIEDYPLYCHELTMAIRNNKNTQTEQNLLDKYSQFASIDLNLEGGSSPKALLVLLERNDKPLFVLAVISTFLSLAFGVISGVASKSLDTGLGVLGAGLGFFTLFFGFLT